VAKIYGHMKNITRQLFIHGIFRLINFYTQQLA